MESEIPTPQLDPNICSELAQGSEFNRLVTTDDTTGNGLAVGMDPGALDAAALRALVFEPKRAATILMRLFASEPNANFRVHVKVQDPPGPKFQPGSTTELCRSKLRTVFYGEMTANGSVTTDKNPVTNVASDSPGGIQEKWWEMSSLDVSEDNGFFCKDASFQTDPSEDYDADGFEKEVQFDAKGGQKIYAEVTALDALVNEVQVITRPLSSTFTITWHGKTTGALNYTDAASVIKQAMIDAEMPINAAGTLLATGHLTVSGDSPDPVVITFENTVRHLTTGRADLELMAVSAGSMAESVKGRDATKALISMKRVE
jgi:hypothetical protein